MDRTELLRVSPLLIELLDTILFRGKTHLKRNACLSVLNDDFLKEVTLKDKHGNDKIRNVVKTEVNSAINRLEIHPSHLNDLLRLDVKQTILDIFKRKRVQTLNGKRKTAPTTEAIVPIPFAQAVMPAQETISQPPNKSTRANDENDAQVLAGFFDEFADCFDATVLQDQPSQPINPCAEYDDLSDFLNQFDWSEEAANLAADATEEAVYNAIYKGANILAATV